LKALNTFLKAQQDTKNTNNHYSKEYTRTRGYIRCDENTRLPISR